MRQIDDERITAGRAQDVHQAICGCMMAQDAAIIERMPERGPDEDRGEPGEKREVIHRLKCRRVQTEREEQRCRDGLRGEEFSDEEDGNREERVPLFKRHEEGEQHDADADQMQHAEANVGCGIEEVRCKRDEHPAEEDHDAASQVFLQSRTEWGALSFHSPPRHGEAHANEEQEEDGGHPFEDKPASAVGINVTVLDGGEVECQVVEDHHQNRERAEEVDFGEAGGAVERCRNHYHYCTSNLGAFIGLLVSWFICIFILHQATSKPINQ